MAMTRQETLKCTRELGQALRCDPRILAAYLHGSFGRESFRPDSDVDCAILICPGQAMSSMDLMRLSGE